MRFSISAWIFLHCSAEKKVRWNEDKGNKSKGKRERESERKRRKNECERIRKKCKEQLRESEMAFIKKHKLRKHCENSEKSETSKHYKKGKQNACTANKISIYIYIFFVDI